MTLTQAFILGIISSWLLFVFGHLLARSFTRELHDVLRTCNRIAKDPLKCHPPTHK